MTSTNCVDHGAPEPGKDLLSVNDVLKRGGIGRNTFYKLVNSGELAVVNIGRRTYVAAPEWSRFLGSLSQREK